MSKKHNISHPRQRIFTDTQSVYLSLNIYFLSSSSSLSSSLSLSFSSGSALAVLCTNFAIQEGPTDDSYPKCNVCFKWCRHVSLRHCDSNYVDMFRYCIVFQIMQTCFVTALCCNLCRHVSLRHCVSNYVDMFRYGIVFQIMFCASIFSSM